jgi:TonB-linked SusC/RagA family outer membrane protein
MKCSSTVIKKPLLPNALLIMKLMALFLLVLTLQVSANGFGQQKINLRLKKTEISDALRLIEKQTNYRFLYNNDLSEIREKVNINVKEAGINEVLTALLQNTALQFQLMNDNLIVIKRDPDAPPVVPDVEVRGVVKDENGVPLAGASVQVKGSTTGTTTNSNGAFVLTVPDANAILVISSIGYEEKEIALAGRTDVEVSMVTSNKVMEQVVVVGYGTQRKLDVTGAVAQIKGDEIAKQASINPISALQGKVAGVFITNSGAPGGAPEIKIRGVGTVFGSTSPLYVVDGVWFDDISFLNPADIENLSILKDASSESIYGIRAANGVVLITTKKGKSGKPVVNYNGYVGYQKVTNQIKMANANEYATMINEKDGVQVLDPSDFGEGTDWYHQILRNALITNHQVSASGGSDKSNYTISFGYLNQDGIVESNNFQRYTARLQQEFFVATPLKIGYTLTGAYSKSDDIDGGIFRQLYTAYPVLPVYYADGTYGDPGDYPLGDGAKYNPQATIDLFDQDTKTYRFTGNVFAELKVAKYFTLRSSFGGEYGDLLRRNYRAAYNLGPSIRNDISMLTLTDEHTRNWIVENTVTFDRRISDHSVRLMIGQGAQSYRFTKRIGSAQNIDNGRNFEYLSLGDNRTIIDAEYPNYPLRSTIASYFTRLNYSFRDRYLLNASLRADGSSKFASPNKWGYFPAVGIGWVITNEDFMADQDVFNNLKLRASWGKVGNASVPANLSIQPVTQTEDLGMEWNGVFYSGASVDRAVPPTTFWEKSVGTDIGIEATLLDNRLNAEIGWYNRKTEDAIFAIDILGSLGFSGSNLIGNQATYQNRGFEFLFSWKDNINSNLTYSISANLGINNNEVLSTVTGGNPIYGGGQGLANGSLATRTVLGQPIGHFYGYRAIGVFQTDAEAAPWGAQAGDLIFEDISGPEGKPDGIIDGKYDRTVLGNPIPKYTYGINTYWAYKDFDLTVDFQGVADVDVYNANLGWRYGNENFSKEFFDNRWHGPGTSNKFPSAKIGSTYNAKPSSFFIESGSYFRIRNVQLGYVLPSSVTNRWHISRLRVFANAQNPFTFFKYSGFSPEIIGGGPTGSGIDANVYPLSATYNFGVNITL